MIPFWQLTIEQACDVYTRFFLLDPWRYEYRVRNGRVVTVKAV